MSKWIRLQEEISAFQDVANIRDKKEGRDCSTNGFLLFKTRRQYKDGANKGNRQHNCKRRNQSSDASRVKLDQRKPVPRFDLSQQELGNYKSGDHEEDIYPDESPREERSGVFKNHQPNSQTPKTLDVPTKSLDSIHTTETKRSGSL